MKRVFAAILTVVFTLAFFAGCNEKLPENDPVVVIVPATQPPAATPAPTATPEPTPVPTPVPTEYKGSDPQPSSKRIYLTFDDCPTQSTAEVLDILARYGIKGTFFTVGFCVEYNPDIAKRIVNEGHLLACHTYSHDFPTIYSSPDAFMKDVAKWRSTVTKAIGWDAGSYYVRFPGGSNNSSVGGRDGRGAYLNALHAAGYRAYDWNCGFNDTWLAGNTSGLPVKDYFWQSYKLSVAQFENSGKPIIFLIHDDADESVELLPALIEDLMARGYSFGTVDELGSDYLM